MASWFERIQHIVNGEPVDSGHAGRPDRQMEQNLRYLRDQLSSMSLGGMLVLLDKPCDPAALVGQAVYWDSEQQKFSQALAQLEFDVTSGMTIAAARSEIIGIIQSKLDSTTATVVIFGWADIDLANSVDDPTIPGRYYLSGTTAGKLVQQSPSFSLPVLYSTGTGQVLVSPVFRNWDMQHSHLKFDLFCVPAGDSSPPDIGQIHQVSNIDTNLPGWIPAGHGVFNGLAPAGAKFGYNLSAHPDVQAAWPPFPVEAACLIFDRGIDRIGGTETPAGLSIIDKNGIWWMSECYDDVPWPTDGIFVAGENTVSESLGPDCPRTEEMSLKLYFSRVLYDATKMFVTSLTPASGSIITLKNSLGNPATTGNLTIDAVLSLLLNQTPVDGFTVLKGITNNRFNVGNVVEGLTVGSDNIQLSSATTKNLGGGVTLYQGRVQVDVVTDPAARELLPATIRLSDTKERFSNGIPYLGFPSGYQTSICCLYYVPIAGLPTTPKIELRFTVLGPTAGALPVLTVSYRRIPVGTTSPSEIPAVDTELEMPQPATLVSGNQYVLVTMPQIDIEAGDTLQVTIQREIIDGYGFEIGVLRPTAVLVQG